MANEIENLVLEHLRAIRADLATVKDDVRRIKVRMTSLEENTAAMNRRLDSMDDRIERIEKTSIKRMLGEGGSKSRALTHYDTKGRRLLWPE